TRGGEVLVLLHGGGIPIPGGAGLLEPGHGPVGFLFREPGRVSARSGLEHGGGDGPHARRGVEASGIGAVELLPHLCGLPAAGGVLGLLEVPQADGREPAPPAPPGRIPSARGSAAEQSPPCHRDLCLHWPIQGFTIGLSSVPVARSLLMGPASESQTGTTLRALLRDPA